MTATGGASWPAGGRHAEGHGPGRWPDEDPEGPPWPGYRPGPPPPPPPPPLPPAPPPGRGLGRSGGQWDPRRGDTDQWATGDRLAPARHPDTPRDRQVLPPPPITPEEAGIFRVRQFQPRTYDARSGTATPLDGPGQGPPDAALTGDRFPHVPPLPNGTAAGPGTEVVPYRPRQVERLPTRYPERFTEPYGEAVAEPFTEPYNGLHGAPPEADPYAGHNGHAATRIGPRHALPAGTSRFDGDDQPLPDGALPHPPRAVIRRRRRRRKMLEWPFLIAFSLIAAVVVRTFVFQTFFIPSPSMHDTLLEGDRVLVNKLSYHLHGVNRGDVVVFRRPENLHIEDEDLIKRVVGLPGETVEAHGSRVFVDGRGLNEPYVQGDCHGTEDFPPVTVPSGHVFVMGDNRCNSTDSRVFGPIDEDLLVGRAFARIWPPSRIGWL